MGGWYWIGVAAGIGAAAGVLLAALTGRVLVLAALLGAGGGALLGAAVYVWEPGGIVEIAVGAAAGALGAYAASQIVRGALRRGGTGAGIAIFVAAAAFGLAALAFVPVVGYVEAIGLPLLAARIRRRLPERYAGLRTLARD